MQDAQSHRLGKQCEIARHCLEYLAQRVHRDVSSAPGVVFVLLLAQLLDRMTI